MNKKKKQGEVDLFKTSCKVRLALEARNCRVTFASRESESPCVASAAGNTMSRDQQASRMMSNYGWPSKNLCSGHPPWDAGGRMRPAAVK